MERSLPRPATTQRALLEHTLARMRSRRVAPFVRNKRVLDFGCGADLWNLRQIHQLTTAASGVDLVFSGRDPFETPDGIRVYSSLDDIPEQSMEVVTSLACFEHIEVADLPDVLRSLSRITADDGVIVGTFPSPAAKPVLEFLAYKLRVIDESQIRDHRIYYSPEEFAEVANSGGWQLIDVKKFQFGFNTFFKLIKLSPK